MTSPPLRVPLTRTRIIDAALALIDTEGLDALSMRKLGAALGVEAMSLYNHVRNKDDLLGAVTDHLYSEILVRVSATTDPTASWQDRARAIAHAYWAVARESPNAFPLVSDKPVDSRPGLEVLARCLEIFNDAGMDLADASAAFHAAAGWMLGVISQEHRLLRKLTEDAGFDRADVPDELVPIVDFRAACQAQRPEERFALGLEILLAGIEARCLAGVPVEP